MRRRRLRRPPRPKPIPFWKSPNFSQSRSFKINLNNSKNPLPKVNSIRFKIVKFNQAYSIPPKKIPNRKLTYPQAVLRYPRLCPFGDADKDGKLNMFDCRPFNMKKHTTVSFKNKKINIETPAEVRPIVDVLNKKGRAYVVGGFVRDTLLEKPPKDVDIEVHGMDPEAISQELKLSGYNVNEVGKSFGVLKVSPMTGSRREAIDVSVPRMDSTGRKPTVEFLQDATPEKAAGRRDFTINAIMYDTKEDQVVDPFQGITDLEKGQIKAVSERAFSEDPLRVVRAAQFASRFDFDIAPETAAEARKANMGELSGERIQEELRKVSAKSKKPSKFFTAMDEMGQLETVFPEVAKLKGVGQDPVFHPEGDAYKHTMDVIDRIGASEDKDHKMFLAGVLHDTGKATTVGINPKTGKIAAIGHEDESAKIAKGFMERLHYPKEEEKEVISVVEHHMEPHHLAITGATKLKHKNRLLAKVAGGYNKLASNPEKALERYKATVKFAEQDKGPDNPILEKYKELEEIPPAEKYRRQAKGEEIIAQGYKGAAVGERLEELYKNQLANIKNEVPSEEETIVEEEYQPPEEIIEEASDIEEENY
jgi:tRNA nucleotidyltransferase (CCA-adding enzyme)